MEHIQLVLEIITVFLGFYLAFFKSFFQEKGKNLATKQDVAEITQLVETVKKQFSNDSEYLKSRLNLYNQNFTSIKTLERNALIELNTKYSHWLNSLQSFSLVFYSYNNFEGLKSMDLFFNEKYLAFNVARDNLHLYLYDPELLKIEKDLTVSTLKLEGVVLTSINNFILNCSDYNVIRASAKQEDQIKLNKDYHNRQQLVIESSIKENNKIFMEAYNHQIDFIKLLNKIIYTLIDESE